MRTARRRRFMVALLGGLLLAPVVGWGAYAVVTWLRFGHAQPKAAADPSMRRYMPRYDVAEAHGTRVAAPPSVTYDAARRMDLHESGVVHAIFRGREIMLGVTAPPRPENFPLVSELLSLGWGVLEEVPGQHLVFGAITQPWEANVAFRALPPRDFASRGRPAPSRPADR